MDEEALRRLEGAPAPTISSELVACIAMSRDALLETLEEFALVDLDRRKPGAWSPKDHVAHLVAWERMIIATARDRSAERFPSLAAPSYAGLALDPLNELLFAESIETHRGTR